MKIRNASDKKMRWFVIAHFMVAAIVASNMYCWSATDEAMDVPVREFSAPSGQELRTICRVLNRPCGYETLNNYAFGKPQGPRLHLKQNSARKILDEIVRRHPGHHLGSYDGVLVIEPIKRVGPDLLARKIDRLSIRGRTSHAAALMVLKQAKIRAEEVSFGNDIYARIDLELNNVTVREALNAIAKADGQVMWRFTPDISRKDAGFFNLSTWHKTGVHAYEDK